MTQSTSITWPAYYPQDCPPEDATPAAGRVFRFVKSDPPTEADFRSHKERWPAKAFGDKECQACGLSVFLDWADVERMRRDVPGMAKKLVAEGVLQETDGVMRSTPARSGLSHHTWWKHPQLAVHGRFTVIANGTGGTN